MSTVLVIGGTTEAREAARGLESAGYRVVVSVATSLGEAYSAGFEVVAGSKDGEALAVQARKCEAALILDCTHPFAIDAGRSAREAAAAAGIPYLRFTRATAASDGVEYADSWEAAVELLAQSGKRALLTIGVRHLEPFAAAGLDFAARVLPLAESIAECARLGLPPRDIIAAFPPHDTAFNRACIRKVGARLIVMKDSGAEGGTPAKIEAAAAEGIRAVMVRRPLEEEGITTLDELIASTLAAIKP